MLSLNSGLDFPDGVLYVLHLHVLPIQPGQHIVQPLHDPARDKLNLLSDMLLIFLQLGLNLLCTILLHLMYHFLVLTWFHETTTHILSSTIMKASTQRHGQPAPMDI